MTKFTQISAIVFFVRDLKRTSTFYREVLGLEVATNEGHDGSFATAQLGSTSLVFIPSEETPGRSPVIVLGVDEGIDDVVEGLIRQGVEIVVPVSEAPDGGWTADFLDPDHHILSLYQTANAPRRRS